MGVHLNDLREIAEARAYNREIRRCLDDFLHDDWFCDINFCLQSTQIGQLLIVPFGFELDAHR